MSHDDHELTTHEISDIVKYWVGIATFVILSRINQMENDIMATLQDLVADDTALTAEVAQIGTDVQSALTALANVEAQLAALQAGGLTADQQAIVDQLHTDIGNATTALTTSDTSIQTALTPPAPSA